MKTSPVAFDDLTRSVIAVPPLALGKGDALDKSANLRLIGHIQQAGVRSLMYGGNANFYNLPISAYAATLSFLAEAAAADCWVIPAVGPDYGRMVDQAPVVRALSFPTAMVLPPYVGSGTQSGFATALRRFSDRIGVPLLIYAKHDNALDPALIGALVDDGVVGWIKYAVVRSRPDDDPYLRALVDRLDPRRIISGIGERPVIEHFRLFGLSSFTSGSIAVAPRLSMAILRSLQAGDYDRAANLRALFMALEDCRDAYGPARVIHDAVTLAGIADMGPITPLQSNLTGTERERTAAAAVTLRAIEERAIEEA